MINSRRATYFWIFVLFLLLSNYFVGCAPANTMQMQYAKFESDGTLFEGNYSAKLDNVSTDILNEKRILKATLSITNLNSNSTITLKDEYVYARTTAGDTLKKLADCGTGLNGSVIPNEKLRGEICWELGDNSKEDIKIFYTHISPMIERVSVFQATEPEKPKK